MILKTGANYQAEGGYIEFATGITNVRIGDKNIPSSVYETVSGISGFISGKISATPEAVTTQIMGWAPLAGTGMPKYRYGYLRITEQPVNITLNTGICANLVAPAGKQLKLGEGCRDVELYNDQEYGWFISVVGPNPVIVMDAEVTG